MDLVKLTEETRTRVRPMGEGKKTMTAVRAIARTCAAVVLVASAFAADFSIGIGPSVAGNSMNAKAAAMVARPEGCGEPAKARFEASAEGLVNGARRSVRLRTIALETPGVAAIMREWPMEGVWVVKLTGTCQSATAGAVVPFGPKGFLRESSKFFSRAANDADVEASLKALANQK